MDPCIILLPAYDKEVVYKLIDLHTLTILMQCIASQEGKLVNGLYWANLHDGGSHLFLWPWENVLSPHVCSVAAL